MNRHTRSVDYKGAKVQLVSLGIGLGAGVLSAFLSEVYDGIGSLFWFIGCIFAASLLVGYLSARSRGRLSNPYSWLRLLGAAIIVSTAWPVAFAGVLSGMGATNSLLSWLIPGIRDSVPPLMDLAVGLFVAAGLSAAVISAGLASFFGFWSRRAFLLLIAAEVTAVLVTLAIYIGSKEVAAIEFQTHRDAIFWWVLLPTGMALATMACTRWLLEDAERTQQN